MFLKEVFMNSNKSKLHDDIIKGVIPLMIQKSFANKKLVKTEA